jgi:hypothetical protein
MKKLFKIFLFGVACFLYSEKSMAQKFRDSTFVKIETIDGNEFLGKIMSQNADQITLKTEALGEVNIPKIKIKTIEKADKTQIKNGQFWEKSVQESRYFWGPSGYGLKKGEGYYQNTWIFLNQVNVGITDNLSIGGGLMPFFGVTPIWITPKLSFPYKTGKGSAGIGAVYFNVYEYGVFDDDPGFNSGGGLVYGMNTWGNRDHQITLGMGYGFLGGNWSNYPVFMASTMQRNNRRWAFISENYVIPVDGGTAIIISAGARFLGKMATFDLGAYTLASSEFGGIPFALPWFSVAFPWKGKEKKK